MYYFHIFTSYLSGKTQGQVQRWVILTYSSRSQKLLKEKRLLSRYLPIYNLYYFHINTNDSYDETQGQVQRWVT